MSDIPRDIRPLLPKPGVKRDGTVFEGDNWVDAQWVRWQRGRPRKMGGYRQINDQFSGVIRGSYIHVNNGIANIYGGGSSNLEVVQANANTGDGAGIVDRTPAGFASSADNVWQFDSLYDTVSSATTIIAHAGQNISAIDNETATPIYYGAADGLSALTSTGASVSGGVVVLHPFLFGYGADGEVIWSDANKPASFTGGFSGQARISARKIVKGLPYRGGRTNSPAGIFWSLDSVIIASFQGGATVFSFDTISANISVLSSSAIVEYDGVYLWPALDRFMMFNGTVREVPNDMNLNYFYDNLNFNYRQKVWGMAIPRYGEVWWFYPSGNSTECDRAIILNVRENTWYDTALSRCCGISSNVFRWPVMFGTEEDDAGKTQLFQHEYGADEVIGSTVNAIPAYVETCDLSMIANDMGADWVGMDRQMYVHRFEPDFIQTGDMRLTVRGRDYARSPDMDTDFSFSPSTEYININQQRREMRLRFESNVAGGDFQWGQNLCKITIGDGNQ